jgi:S1 RNA binding domain protein
LILVPKTGGAPGAKEKGEQKSRMEPQVGSILEGKVTTITKFGAFVSLGDGKSGLVHISEIANTFVNDVHDYLQEGQTVRVLVLSAENGRINLSVKKALPQEERPAPRPFRPAGGFGGGAPRPAAPRRSFSPRGAQNTTPPPSGDQSFEDKLKQFMSASEGIMADLNRNIDGKRGGGRRRK